MKTVQCPHCHGELNAGQILSQCVTGRRRRISDEHRAKLLENLKKARERLAAERAQQTKEHWTQIPH